jgi:hypothetical protein
VVACACGTKIKETLPPFDKYPEAGVGKSTYLPVACLSSQSKVLNRTVETMKLHMKQLVVPVLASMCCLPSGAQAESSSSNTAPYSAAARLNLRVVIPQFLQFQVGSAGTGTIDTIVFEPAAGNVGDSSTVSGTGGDTASGSGATVLVRGNGGLITITETNNGGGSGFSDIAGNTISLAEISVDSTNPSLPTPELSDLGGNTSQPSLNGGASQVTNQTSTWVYSYDNTTTPEAGTYNVQITYTASMP